MPTIHNSADNTINPTPKTTPGDVKIKRKLSKENAIETPSTDVLSKNSPITVSKIGRMINKNFCFIRKSTPLNSIK